MRVGPTTPIVPSVASPALNGAVTSDASHSPVVGCSVADRHREPRRARAARPAGRAASPARARGSRTAGGASRGATRCASSARFDTPPTTTWPAALARAARCAASRPRRSSRSRCSRGPSAASCSSRACASMYVMPAERVEPALGRRAAPGRRASPGRSRIRLSTRPCWPDGEDHHRRPHVDQLQADDRLLATDGGTARPAYCVSRESSCTLPFRTSSRSRIASAK